MPIAARGVVGPFQIELRLAQLGDGGADLGVVRALITQLLSRLFQIRPRPGHLALGGGQVGAHVVGLGLGDQPLLLQLEDARALDLHVLKVDLGLGEVGLGDLDLGRAGADGLCRRLQRGARLFHLQHKGSLIDPGQQVVALNELRVGHRQRGNVARDLRHHLDHDRLDPRERRVGRDAIGEQVPDEQQQCQDGDKSCGCFHPLACPACGVVSGLATETPEAPSTNCISMPVSPR